MKDLVEYLVKAIVAKPSEVAIDEETLEGNTILKVKVADDDYGVVVGKGGRTIRSIKDLVRLKSEKKGLKVNVTLSEPSRPVINEN